MIWQDQSKSECVYTYDIIYIYIYMYVIYIYIWYGVYIYMIYIYIYVYIYDIYIYICSNLKHPAYITHYTLTQRRSHELFSTMNMNSIKSSLEQTKWSFPFRWPHMRFVQWILGRKHESQLPEAVTRNMPKTVLWLLRHRASRQNYGVYIWCGWAGELGPVVRVFGWYMVIYGHLPRIYHWKKLEIGFKHQWIHPFPMWTPGFGGSRAPIFNRELFVSGRVRGLNRVVGVPAIIPILSISLGMHTPYRYVIGVL